MGSSKKNLKSCIHFENFLLGPFRKYPRVYQILPNSDIFATRYCRPLIFQAMNSIRSNNPSLKYQRFSPSGWKDLGNRKVCDKTQFLSIYFIKSFYVLYNIYLYNVLQLHN